MGQETLADLAGLTTRTVQRVEAGEQSSTDTRRALARAFQLPDMNFFLKPNPFPTLDEIVARHSGIGWVKSLAMNSRL